MRYMTLTTAAPLSLLLLATLSACGESDLDALHASEIAAAREAAGEGGASTAGGSTGTATDGGTDTSTAGGTDGATDGTDGTTGTTGSGSDGSTDGGTDGATDGTDGTTDNGTDGTTDSGTDGGTDGTTGGATDGGSDAGTDGSTTGGDTPVIGAAHSEFVPDGYELVFSDEFDGASLDASKWNTAFTWGPDLVIFDQLQYYVDTANQPDFGYDPLQFDGSALTLTASETPGDLAAAAGDQPYLSGVITTADKFDLTFGYIEARLDLPEGAGLWPAFWMLGSDFEGLKPELYILEHNGATPDSAFLNYNYHDEDGNLRSPGQLEVTEPGLADGYHLYAVKWSSEEIIYYIDGEPRYRIIGSNVPAQPMYLLLNLAVGGVWVGAPDADTGLPAGLSIDYVRVYQSAD